MKIFTYIFLLLFLSLCFIVYRIELILRTKRLYKLAPSVFQIGSCPETFALPCGFGNWNFHTTFAIVVSNEIKVWIRPGDSDGFSRQILRGGHTFAQFFFFLFFFYSPPPVIKRKLKSAILLIPANVEEIDPVSILFSIALY